MGPLELPRGRAATGCTPLLHVFLVSHFTHLGISPSCHLLKRIPVLVIPVYVDAVMITLAAIHSWIRKAISKAQSREPKVSLAGIGVMCLLYTQISRANRKRTPCIKWVKQPF